jgi:hypothetical protein
MDEARSVSDEAQPISPRMARALWAVGGAAACCVLALSRWLTPDPSGMGTHTQLGLPPCGFLVLTSIPCPTCGLTTSFAHMARLQITDALHAHPLGPLLFALTAIAVLVCAWSCARGSPPVETMKRLRVARLLVIIAAAAVIAWLARLWAIFAT